MSIADLLADAWFGTKDMIHLSQETALVPVLRIKKNKMKCRINEFVRGKTVSHEWDFRLFNKHCVRKTWQPICGQKYQAKIVYSLCWVSKVYFKEAKQHLGFLKEPSNHYAAYIASIHLTAIRFCLLVIAKQRQSFGNSAQARQTLCSNGADISFAGKL
jgi:hypothetical protein